MDLDAILEDVKKAFLLAEELGLKDDDAQTFVNLLIADKHGIDLG